MASAMRTPSMRTTVAASLRPAVRATSGWIGARGTPRSFSSGPSPPGVFQLLPSFTSTIRQSPLSRSRLLSTCAPFQAASALRLLLLASSKAQRRSFGSGISRNLLANREEAANRNPGSATAQNAFYQVLLKANMPAIVVERHNSGRFASNEATRDAYHRALGMLQAAGGVTPAVAPGVVPGLGAAAANTAAGGLSNAQLQAVGQAVAAHANGGGVATAQESKGGPLHVVVNDSLSKNIFRWVRFFVVAGIACWFGFAVLSIVLDFFTTVKKAGGVAGSSRVEVKSEKQTARFSDVHGCNEAKEELQDLVEFLKNPERFSALGGKLPRGVLLVGPPGTGKTLLARAVAGEAGVPFHYMSGSEFDEMYVGVGARRVRDLFSAAKAHSPSIVFIDELDAVGGKRNAREQAYHRQTLNQLLTELDGFNQDSGVVVIAATNFPESLDKALTRPGRFDRHVSVELPDVRGRIDILKHHAQKIKAAKDVDLKSIAMATPGLSGAELESIVNQAAIHASKEKSQSVTTRDFDWAKDKVIMGAERKSMIIDAKEKEMTAYHEAGHALILFYAKAASKTLYKVTILPRGRSLGHTAYLPMMDKYSHTVRNYLTDIETCLGGKIAEELAYGQDSVTSGVSSDLNHATKIAYQMVARFGMSQKLGPVDYGRSYDTLSNTTKAMIEAEVQKILEEAQQRGTDLLQNKRKELDLLARALLEYETLDFREVGAVIKGESLPGRTKVPINTPMIVPARESPLENVPPFGGSGSGEEGGGKPPAAPAPPPPAAGAAKEDVASSKP